MPIPAPVQPLSVRVGRPAAAAGYGKDMSVKYKETSRGGLAVNVVEC